MVRTPEAQCLEPLSVRLHLAACEGGIPPLRAPAGFRAVIAGDEPRMPPDTPMLELPQGLELSAWKPACCGVGWIIRLLNPMSETCEGFLRPGLPFETVHEVGLDEEPLSGPLAIAQGAVAVGVRPHGLLTLHFNAPS